LKQQLRHLLSQHADVTHADIDLAAVEDVDEATAVSNELGFFVARLIVHADGHDHLWLQLLDSAEIELEDVVWRLVVRTALRRNVLEDRSRVSA
jgi:hypothetical protein